jgi:hypothetical protein
MKIIKAILLISLIVILSILYLNLTHNQAAAVSRETSTINQMEMQKVLEATIQIYMFPQDSLNALGVVPGQKSLNDAIADANVEYRYEMGLGTLVNQNGEIIIITHDHWKDLDALGMIQFRNAAGDALLELDGDTFKALIRYQDGGTMILGRDTEGDRSDYLSALIAISQAKYNRRIMPAELGLDQPIHEGQNLIIVRQGRSGSKAVELMAVNVEAVGERWGQLVYKLRSEDGDDIMPGDSGGGLWLEGRLIGNMWKSKYTYGVDWDALELEQHWTETSYAAGLPDFSDEVPQVLETDQIVDDVESMASAGEF